jgi:hypothetical protein
MALMWARGTDLGAACVVGHMRSTKEHSLTCGLAGTLQTAAFNSLPQGATDDAPKILRKPSFVCSGGSTLHGGCPRYPRFVPPCCIYA